VTAASVARPAWAPSGRAIQDEISDNYCWGCGSLNDEGLHIKSYWQGEETICVWQPAPRHMAGPRHIVNGGIIATVIDCHSVCTAVAAAYRAEGRPISSEPLLWYATAALNVQYLKPAPIRAPLRLRAQVAQATERKTIVTCTVEAESERCAEAEVVAVRVPWSWRVDKQ
jgi:acyl-coenzyme A thioesterase PaaI-like protein